MARRRRWWRRWQQTADAGRIVTIDETALRTDLTRLRGRAPRGQRLRGPVPHARWRTSTLIAAMDTSGMRCSAAVEGAVDRATFEAFVEHVLVPTLVPGDIVVMDNLSSHRGKRVRALIRAAGCRCVYLPPYSYDLNPIEQAFAKLKQLIRGAMDQAERTVEALWEAAGRITEQITPLDAANFFRHCGYHLPATHEPGPL